MDYWPKGLEWTPAQRRGRGGYDNCGPLWPYGTFGLGGECEDQATADERIPCYWKAPARCGGISAEAVVGRSCGYWLGRLVTSFGDRLPVWACVAFHLAWKH